MTLPARLQSRFSAPSGWRRNRPAPLFPARLRIGLGVCLLVAFRSGARKNSPQMEAIAKRMSDDEIQAVADYMAGLK